MFYHVTISQNIDLEPMYFGPKLRETIRLKIVDKVCSCLQQQEQQQLRSCKHGCLRKSNSATGISSRQRTATEPHMRQQMQMKAISGLPAAHSLLQ
jgi:hypothetical protein